VAQEARLRISVGEGWRLREFGMLLELVDRCYFRLAILSAPQFKHERLASIIEDIPERELSFSVAASVSRRLFSRARAEIGELGLERIQIASPGLFELAADATIAGLMVQIFTLLRGTFRGRSRRSTEREAISAIREIARQGIDASSQNPAIAEVIERMVRGAAIELAHVAMEKRVTDIQVVDSTSDPGTARQS